MNITQLIYFNKVVYYEFNISLAANRLNVSQSTISKAINSFESSQDVKLFIRRGRRILGLTNKGKIFYRNSKKVVADYHRMMTEMHQAHKLLGTLKIGVPSVVYDALFSKFLPTFKLQHPEINLHMIIQGSDMLQDQLVLNKLDLAYIVAPVKYDVLITKQLISDGASILYNPKFFDLNQNMTISELSNYNFVLLSQGFALRSQIDSLFELNNQSPNVIINSTSESFLINSCRNNRVLTILPTAILQGYDISGLEKIPLKQIDWRLMTAKAVNNANPIVKPIQQEIDKLIMNVMN